MRRIGWSTSALKWQCWKPTDQSGTTGRKNDLQGGSSGSGMEVSEMK